MSNLNHIQRYSTRDYCVTIDRMGHYEVRNIHNGKSVYLQGEDATQFERETLATPVSHLNVAISNYDEVMQ